MDVNDVKYRVSQIYPGIKTADQALEKALLVEEKIRPKGINPKDFHLYMLLLDFAEILDNEERK